MSGEIKLLSRNGERHAKGGIGIINNPDTDTYQEWYIGCTDENFPEKKVYLSPKFTDIGELLSKIINHEIENDCDKKLDRNPASINHAAHFLWYILKSFGTPELQKAVIIRAIKNLPEEHFRNGIDKDLKEKIRTLKK